MKSDFVIIACIFIFACCLVKGQEETSPPPQCRPGLIIDCNFYLVDFVWAKNETLCVPYVNRCVFNNVNCRRYRNGLPLFEETTQAECQPLCVRDCSNAVPPTKVCAQRDQQAKYFNNQCALDQYICQNAEMWWATGDSVCQAETA